MCTAALDWADATGVGFSHFVALGDSLDVDAGDVLDYLSADTGTRAILVYLESVPNGRKLLSAARAAARNKPVIVVKAGRMAEGARAAASHTGALAASDEVVDAAFRRAGMLRVTRVDELFDAAESLARQRALQGERLALVTNGGGPGVLAVDALAAGGGTLAVLTAETLAKLDAVLPAGWSRGNPVDVVGDAPPERIEAALRAVVDAPEVDAVLVIHAPTALASSEGAARAVATLVRERPRRGVFASWLGRRSAEPARAILREAGIATYDTHDDAISAWLHRIAFQRSQELLMETPPSLPREFVPDREGARALVARALAAGRSWLAEDEAGRLLRAFDVPVVETRRVGDAEAAARAAAALDVPVALKVVSPQVLHKSDVGGVVLDLVGGDAVREAARAMAERVMHLVPGAKVEGFLVQPMARRPGAVELIVGATSDPAFGPVLLFGEGGTAVEVIADRAVGLPPLNLPLARALVARTRVARRLAAARDRPAADLDAVLLTLVKVSQLLVDVPEVAELDVNPLLADAGGVLALDARVRVERPARADRLAIRPYPRELEEVLTLPGGERVPVRPIRPEDEPAHQRFLARLAKEDVYFRFFNMVREMPHTQMARYTQIDYDREMAFIATDATEDETAETLGVVRSVFHPDGTQAEFAIIVRSDQKGRGLGRALLEKMIRYARERGAGVLVGQVLPENHRMLDLVADLGFERHLLADEGIVEVRLPLAGAAARRSGARARTRGRRAADSRSG